MGLANPDKLRLPKRTWAYHGTRLAGQYSNVQNRNKITIHVNKSRAYMISKYWLKLHECLLG